MELNELIVSLVWATIRILLGENKLRIWIDTHTLNTANRRRIHEWTRLWRHAWGCYAWGPLGGTATLGKSWERERHGEMPECVTTGRRTGMSKCLCVMRQTFTQRANICVTLTHEVMVKMLRFLQRVGKLTTIQGEIIRIMWLWYFKNKMYVLIIKLVPIKIKKVTVRNCWPLVHKTQVLVK